MRRALEHRAGLNGNAAAKFFKEARTIQSTSLLGLLKLNLPPRFSFRTGFPYCPGPGMDFARYTIQSMSLLATAVLNLPPPGGGSFGAP
jgi:hypothetical protein